MQNLEVVFHVYSIPIGLMENLSPHSYKTIPKHYVCTALYSLKILLHMWLIYMFSKPNQFGSEEKGGNYTEQCSRRQEFSKSGF